MKRILFITTSDLSGSSGDNVATKEIVAAFARNDSVSVSVACPAPLEEIPENLKQSVSEFYFLTPRTDESISNHIKTQLSIAFRVGSVLTRSEFDLFVVRHSPVMIAPTILSKVFRVPYVLLARGLSHERLRFSLLLKKIFWLNVRTSQEVYCAYSEIVDRVDAIRPSTMPSPVLFPNAVDPNKFGPFDKTAAREDLSLNYTDSQFVVGFVGSLRPYHMIKELLLAVDRLSEDIQLLLVGDGPERESLESLTEELALGDQVTFTGFINHDNIDQYIGACDVMYGAIDPDHPGNAIKCYEYLACSRPIITDRRSEFEFVEEIDAGITIKKVTVDSVAATINRFKSMSPATRLEMGARGREHILNEYTWDSLVELVLNDI